MKKFFILQILICCFLSLYVNSSESNGFALTSPKIFPFSKFIAIEKGNLLLFENLEENQDDYIPIKIVINEYGELFESKKIKTGFDSAVGVANLSDGNFLYVGNLRLDSNQFLVGLIKVDENGEIIWGKAYMYPSNDYLLNNVIETSDKGFMLLFYLIDLNPIAVLTKIDEYGNVLWEKSYKNIDSPIVIETSDGGFLLTSIKGDYTSVLLKLSREGDILWRKTMKSGKQLWIGGMANYGKNVLISCRIQDDKLNHACGLIEVDEAGNIIKKIGFTNSFSYSGIPCIKKINDDEYAIINNVKNSDTDWDIWIMSLDNQLNLRWESIFGYSYWDSVDEIVKAGDQYYLIGDFDNNYPNGNSSKSLIMKLNSFGSLGFYCNFEKALHSTTCSFSVNSIDEIVTSASDLNLLSNYIDFAFGESIGIDFTSLCSPSCPTIDISPSSLPTGRSGEAYSAVLTASGGSAPYKFSISSGNLPNGLSLSESGTISGTPSEGGDYNFTVSVVDASYCGGKRDYLLHIETQPPSISSVSKLSDPFRLKVTGSNFHSDLKVYIGGDENPWTNVKFKSSSQIVLKGGSALKAKFPKGVPVEIKIVNGDGGEATFTYKR